MTKQQAVIELAKYDHGFLSKQTVLEINTPFGFEGFTYLAKANPNDFKGLSLQDDKGNQIDELEGMDAHKVAIQICQHLDIDYPDMNGIGSQLYSCIKALQDHLDK